MLLSQVVSSWEMFASATRNFVEEVDKGGLLIPVSSLNDTIALLTVVVKRKRLWPWQKPKYIPTDFNFNDILSGDTPVKPGKHLYVMYQYVHLFLFVKYPHCIINCIGFFSCVITVSLNVSLYTGVLETDFIKYNGTYGGNIEGNMEANFAHGSVNLEGKGSSKLQLVFGSLKKEEIEVQKLLRDSKDRLVPHLFTLSPL